MRDIRVRVRVRARVRVRVRVRVKVRVRVRVRVRVTVETTVEAPVYNKCSVEGVNSNHYARNVIGVYTQMYATEP
jgi:hypothetical protein